MKKEDRILTRYRWIVVAAVCVAVCLGLFGWFNNPARVFAPIKDQEPDGSGVRPGQSDSPDRETYVSNELVGVFETEEQAKECAELYGIELISFSYGVAVFEVSGDPKTLIEEGKRNGWPELSLNYRYSAFGKE